MAEGTEPRGIALALDVGATKAAVARVEPDGTVLERDSVPTAGVDDPFAGIGELLLALRGDAVVCGIGSAGPMTERGERVSPVNLPAWRDFPLRSRVAEVTGLPTFLDGDAKALALAEGRFGAAQGVDRYLAVVVSTGVGGGIVLDGRLLDGAFGNAGHIGHVIVEPDGRPCGCGGRGCLEAEVSGTAITAVTGRPPLEAPAEVRARAGRLTGQAVASVANLLDLRLAVVAGSVALGFGDVFFAAAQAELDLRARLAFSAGARIVPSTLADGPVLGAACVGWRGETG
ncbi:MAG: putative sugar kinase [Actinomycetia bacterium]|nr:putative sugar kinase [Actinomycetes bacterium]